MGKTGHPIMRILSLILGLVLVGVGLSVPICQAADSESIAISITVPDIWAPNAITNLSALTGAQEGTVDLNWTAPADNPEGEPVSWYVVKWATFSIADLAGDTTAWWNSAPGMLGYEPIPPDTPGQTAYKTIDGLAGGATYWFAIKSRDDATPSNFSPIDTTSPQASAWVVWGDTTPPAAITDLQAFPGDNDGRIDLVWTEPGDDGNTGIIIGGCYRIQYSTDSAFVWTGPEEFSYEWSPAQIVPGNIGESTRGELEPGTTYYFRIWTRDEAFNWSTISNGATAWAQNYPPAPPSGLVAKSGNEKITLTWNPNLETDISRYWVYRSTTSGAYDYSVVLATVTHPTTVYEDTGLTNDITYYYVVKAVDRTNLVSDASEEVSARPSLRPPREPIGVKGTIIDGGKHIKLQWKAVTKNADGSPCTDLYEYRIYQSTSLAGFSVELSTTVPQPVLSWDETEDITNKTYYYKVRAVDIGGVESDDSMIIMAKDGRVNVIALAKDTQAKLLIPEELTDVLYKESSSYGDDLNIEVEEVETEENQDKVISCYEYSAWKGYGNETLEQIESFSFAKPKASVSLSYEVDNQGLVKGTGIKASQAGRGLALFWFNGIEWVKLGAKTDTVEQVLTIRTKKLGIYKIKESFAATEFTLNKVYPRIFTPNNDGLNDVVNFEYANPNDKGVVCRIFDIRGALVRQLDIGQTETSFIWDGKDQKGKVAPSGIYIYQLEAERKVINGTVILAK